MDPRQEEALTQFARLLEVLSDPKALKESVSDMKSTIEEHKKMVGIVNTKELADSYLKKAEEALKSSAESIDKDWDAHEARKKLDMDTIKASKDESYQQSQKAMKLMGEANQKMADASVMEDNAKDLMQKAMEQMNSNKKWAADLAEQEAQLKDKADKLKQLMGG